MGRSRYAFGDFGASLGVVPSNGQLYTTAQQHVFHVKTGTSLQQGPACCSAGAWSKMRWVCCGDQMKDAKL